MLAITSPQVLHSVAPAAPVAPSAMLVHRHGVAWCGTPNFAQRLWAACVLQTACQGFTSQHLCRNGVHTMQTQSHKEGVLTLHHVKGRQEGGVFYLLFLLAYAFTVLITFLTGLPYFT
jgi:hypothetical protein